MIVSVLQGFKYSGTQAIVECYCDNSYGSHGSASNCNLLCPNDDGEQICGGALANTVYDTSIGKCTLTAGGISPTKIICDCKSIRWILLFSK